MLLSHAVLLELYQEKLVTENEVKIMTEEGGDLFDRLSSIQYIKPPEVVIKISAILAKFGHKDKSRELRGW